MKQTLTVMESEGDAWYERNRSRLGIHDPVTKTMQLLRLHPETVLEVGCSNGWRLKRLREMYDCSIYGIDPSGVAIADAHEVTIKRGIASELPFVRHSFDMVIYGFCLYLCEPQHLFDIASEGNRVLQDDGYLIIHDFADDQPPFSRKYEHREGMLAYHMDYARLWLGHPWFRRVSRKSYPTGKVTVLQKRPGSAFPLLKEVSE